MMKMVHHCFQDEKASLKYGIERNVTKKYIQLQEKNTVSCLKMMVLQMLQMLQWFFALATHKGKFETEEDFADTIVSCYDWTTWWVISPSITDAVHGIRTDYKFCDGYVPLKKHGILVKAPCLL